MTSDRIPLIAGNWKMNGSRREALAWAAVARDATAGAPNEAALFPPFPWLADVAGVLEGTEAHIALGAQACHPEARGAFTGAVAGSMLIEAGCRYVLCGHSERRTLFGETDAFVAASMAAALSAGLEPVLCVGETQAERESGRAREVVLRQLDAGLAVLRGPDDPLTLAYEPVWAIGTGLAATPVEAAEVHGWIRERVAGVDAARAERVRILYGGSANPDNIGGFLGVPDVDGALIGGASLDPDAFGRMIRAAPETASGA